MEIGKYSKADAPYYLNMLIDEGDEWSDNNVSAGRDKYIKALESSITYIAENHIGEICLERC